VGARFRSNDSCCVKRMPRTGAGRHLHAVAEEWLSQWMADNAFVAWAAHPEPWIIEHQMLKLALCPLNLADNEHHAFNAALREMRRAAVLRAKALPLAL